MTDVSLPRGTRSRPTWSEDTRERILDAAERLFAERGVDGTTLHEIHLASGQRNKAAVHYHFGDKRSLLRAVLTRRMRGIAERGNALLDELEARADPPTLQELIEASVTAYIETLEEPWGCDFSQLLIHAVLDRHQLMTEDDEDERSHDRRFGELLRSRLEPLHEDVVRERRAAADVLVCGMMAVRASRMAQGDADLLPLEDFASLLVHALVAIFSTPSSGSEVEG